MHKCLSVPSASQLESIREITQIFARPTNGLKALNVTFLLFLCLFLSGPFALAKPTTNSSEENAIPQQIPISANNYLDPSKLIVLSTGAQLKLYPILDGNQVSTNNYYVLRTRSKQKAMQQNESSKYRSILHSMELAEETLQSPQMITKMDTFLDARFCRSSLNSTCYCLVVVWFDASDHSVHYGSVDLDPILSLGSIRQTDLPVRARQVDKVLSLREFVKPVRLSSESNVIAMTVDKILLRLYLATNETSSDNLRSSQSIWSIALQPVIDTMATPQSTSAPELVRELHNFEQVKESSELIVDELNGDLLYYLDSSSKIRVLHLFNQQSQSVGATGTKLASFTWSTRAQRFFAIESATNEAISMDVSGDNISRLGSLQSKPQLRSIDRLDIMEKTLYVSDSIRKSIVCFDVASERSAKSASLSNVNESISIGGNSKSNKSHRVLVVEMPTVLDFRSIDLSHADTVEGLSCFDDGSRFCSRSVEPQSGRMKLIERRGKQTKFSCDVKEVARWKQEISERRKLGDGSALQQTAFVGKGPQLSSQRQNIVSSLQQIFDLRNETDKSNEIAFSLLESANQSDSTFSKSIQMRNVCSGLISVAFVIVIVALLIIVYVTRRTCSYPWIGSNSAHKSSSSSAKTDPLRPYVLKPKQDTDKRPLVATIDCEPASRWNHYFDNNNNYL